MRVLVTGAAGFIGSQLCLRLLARGDEVWGLDNLDPGGDVPLKRARLALLQRAGARFHFTPLDLRDAGGVSLLLAQLRPDGCVHLAAHVGVRRGPVSAADYAQTNVAGFVHLLEACAAARVGHVLFASSSSVYGEGVPGRPSRETDAAGQPLSVYAATKRAGELLAHAFAHLHGLPLTGLRLFTVYGPWGRPDMAPLRMVRLLREGRPLRLHGGGRMERDFTYVDDVVEALLRVLARPPPAVPVPFRLLNVGGGRPVSLRELLRLLESATGLRAQVEEVCAEPGEVWSTWADVRALRDLTGFAPGTPLEEGVGRMVAWDAQRPDTR